MMMNQHTWDPTKSGSGAYMMLSNGSKFKIKSKLETLNSEKNYNDI